MKVVDLIVGLYQKYLLAFSSIQFATTAGELIAITIALAKARRIFWQRWWWNGTSCYGRFFV